MKRAPHRQITIDGNHHIDRYEFGSQIAYYVIPKNLIFSTLKCKKNSKVEEFESSK